MNQTKEETWLLEEKYQGVPTPAYEADRARLRKGEPLAYLIGHLPFLNTTIYLDSRPLIPRTETEFWVSELIAEQKAKGFPALRVLDLCAGSGCIGVAIGVALTPATIDFSELDPAHQETILKNCTSNGLSSDRVRLWLGDLFAAVPADHKYNLIVSNPPYLDPALDRTTKSVRDFEPYLALYGGKDGFQLLKQIIIKAPQFLLPQGELWLEHEPEQAELIRITAGKEFTVTTHTDQYGLARYSKLVLQ